MIPKVIHYCWFGGNPLPEIAIKCINSWKEKCPDYEIIEWNEKNYDLNACDYVKEAYQAKKWAFVSDYARFDILYRYGGLYFDTDVELISEIDDIVEKGPFMGRESTGLQSVLPTEGDVNSGLGLCAEPKMEFYQQVLEYYQGEKFINSDGSENHTTVVKRVSQLLMEDSYDMANKEIQYRKGIYIYPAEYFCPLDYYTGKLTLTENTRSIHHYTATWHDEKEKRYYIIQQNLCNTLGIPVGYRIYRIIDFPYRVRKKIEKLGFKGTCIFAYKKLMR